MSKRIVIVAITVLAFKTATSQPGLPPFPSARDVLPVARCHVDLKDSSYSYTYDISNKVGAKQPIDDFFIPIGNTAISGASAEPFWDGSHMMVKSIRSFDWGANVPSATIRPGQGSKRFTLKCRALPGIVFAHASGVIPPDTAEDETEFDTTGADELSNSVSVATIGPVGTHLALNQVNFLDTMSSFVNQSRSLTWISTEETAKKYLGYLSTARAQLLSGKKSEANEILKTILSNADVDSSSVITSEAYALIRWNTEYLADKLKGMK